GREVRLHARGPRVVQPDARAGAHARAPGGERGAQQLHRRRRLHRRPASLRRRDGAPCRRPGRHVPHAGATPRPGGGAARARRGAERRMTPGERWRYLGSLRFWLTPGMGVKRHVAWAVGGALLLVLGTTGVVLWALAEGRQVVAQPIENVLAGAPWRRVGGWVSLGSMLLGSGLAIAAVGRLNRSLLSNWTERPYEAAQVIHRRVRLARGPSVVALGGGSGLSNLLRGLREHTSNLTAVVAVSDDGGSSGRLRAAFDMPAPGDLTDCLAALSDHESELTPLLQYRFERGGEL